MNYRHLEYFVKVVQHGSIKGAAEQLGVSQPALSSAIRKLEEDFGTRLLDRRREGSVPTIYGRSLYDSAITMGSVMRNAREKINALQDPNSGQLRVGTGPSVSNDQVAAAMAELIADHPKIRVEQVSDNSFESFEQRLIVKEIDVALCYVPERQLPKMLQWQRITENPIGALVAAAHVPLDTTSVTGAEMIGEFRWITSRDDELRPPEGIPTRARLRGGNSPISVITDDLLLIRHLTLTTHSIGFLPLHMVEAELTAGDFVELVREGITMSRPIYALMRPNDESTPLVRRFLKIVKRKFNPTNRRKTTHRTIAIT